MHYWWVNQNQTYRHEVPGGYLWSPKRKANQAQNPFYDFMREVTPGDVIFSFSNTNITGVNHEEHLRASHCKPWRDANNEERRIHLIIAALPNEAV